MITKSVTQWKWWATTRKKWTRMKIRSWWGFDLKLFIAMNNFHWKHTELWVPFIKSGDVCMLYTHWLNRESYMIWCYQASLTLINFILTMEPVWTCVYFITKWKYDKMNIKERFCSVAMFNIWTLRTRSCFYSTLSLFFYGSVFFPTPLLHNR